jgi:chitinase
MTWIYNDIGGNIIFAITPFYPFLFCDPDEEPNYLPYEEWIKSYKPYLIAKLSRETAEQWLAQANSILEQIDKNNPH